MGRVDQPAVPIENVAQPDAFRGDRQPKFAPFPLVRAEIYPLRHVQRPPTPRDLVDFVPILCCVDLQQIMPGVRARRADQNWIGELSLFERFPETLRGCWAEPQACRADQAVDAR